MNADNEKILERVRALLAMAADTSSPNEASIAAGRARKLMDQHQISLADLKESNGFGFGRAGQSYRFMPKWKDILAVAVGTFNDCKVIRHHEYKAVNNSYSYHIVFQGYEADVAMATVLYDYLCGTIDRLCGVYIAELGTYKRYPAKLGDAYKKGASLELCTRLRDLSKERAAISMSTGTSLVVFKMAAVEGEFGKAEYVNRNLTTRYGQDVDAAKARGHRDGAQISIQQQLQEN